MQPGSRDGANWYLLSENNLDRIIGHIGAMRPLAIVVDSIQTVYLDAVPGSPGSVPQVLCDFSSSYINLFVKRQFICSFIVMVIDAVQIVFLDAVLGKPGQRAADASFQNLCALLYYIVVWLIPSKPSMWMPSSPSSVLSVVQLRQW